MDRRQQRGLALGVFCVAAGFLPLCPAQEVAPSPTVTATATPKPSISPTPHPPAATATPRPAPTERKAAPMAAKPVPTLTAPGKPDGSAEESNSRKADRKARRDEIERFLDGKGGEGPMNKLLDRLPPDADRDKFRKNLVRWRDMTPAERDVLRGQVDDRGERIKEEIEKTVQDSGLRLSPEQMEVYSLRYAQERRKLEKALRDQMGTERAKRLPAIVEQLKREFSATPTPVQISMPKPATPHPLPPVTATPAPTVSPEPTTTPNPSVTPTAKQAAVAMPEPPSRKTDTFILR